MVNNFGTFSCHHVLYHLCDFLPPQVAWDKPIIVVLIKCWHIPYFLDICWRSFSNWRRDL